MTFAGKSMTEANDTSGTVARTVDQVQTSAHRVIDQASGAARPAVDRFAAGAHQAVDTLAGAANETAAKLNARGGQLRAAHLRMSDTCSGYVRDQPFTSIGIAVAAGFLLSLVLTRR